MDIDSDELAGRIEGVARFAMYLATKLHRDGVVDLTEFIALSHARAEDLQAGSPVATQVARRTLRSMTKQMEAALQSTGHLT